MRSADKILSRKLYGNYLQEELDIDGRIVLNGAQRYFTYI
jgi:hypothetical protein